MKTITDQCELELPHGNTVIWRYMSLDKFLNLFISKRLFFSNMYQLSDRYEADIPILNKKIFSENLRKQGLNEDEIRNKIGMRSVEIFEQKNHTLVNCWSIELSESYALWKIYLGGSKAGVAIKSTIGRLKRVMDKCEDSFIDHVYIAKVNYTDYLKEEKITRINLVTTKNKFYSYENELRLIFLYPYDNSPGIFQPAYSVIEGRSFNIDPEILIERIYISPFTGKWFESTLSNLIEKINPYFSDKIEQSQIFDE